MKYSFSCKWPLCTTFFSGNAFAGGRSKELSCCCCYSCKWVACHLLGCICSVRVVGLISFRRWLCPHTHQMATLLEALNYRIWELLRSVWRWMPVQSFEEEKEAGPESLATVLPRAAKLASTNGNSLCFSFAWWQSERQQQQQQQFCTVQCW